MVEKDVLISSLAVREVSPQACCECASSLKKKTTILFSTIHQSEIWSFTQHCEFSITLEVLYSFDPQLQGGIFIAYKNSLWVLLKGRNCPHVIHTFFYGFVQSKCLVRSSDENHDLRNEETWAEGLCDWAKKLTVGGFCWCVTIEQCTALKCFTRVWNRNKTQQKNIQDWRHSSGVLTSFASMTVPTPTVSAIMGTFDRSLSKYRALAITVSFASVFTLVLETRLEPGSLKATWPSGPIPGRTKGEV